MDCFNGVFNMSVQNTSPSSYLDHLSIYGACQLPDLLLSPLFEDSHPKAFWQSSSEPQLTVLAASRNSPENSQISFFPSHTEQVLRFLPTHRTSPQEHDNFTRTGTKLLSLNHDISLSTRKNTGSNQTRVGRLEELEEGVMIQSQWHLSQHVSMANRAVNLQHRMLVALGKLASRHLSHQLDVLKNKLVESHGSHKKSTPPDPLAEIFVSADTNQGHNEPLKPRDLEILAHNGHTVLQGLLESLDSDATVGSSDEECDFEDSKHASEKSKTENKKASPSLWEGSCSVCECRWLKDRAELCSRWTWLEMRLSELDSRIQQIEKLQQEILSSKGRVVLAESQPLTDKQIQHTLWTETMDLSFTAGNMCDFHSDLEMEGSSPTRLLRNIERQSAQLTQIVNSLMPSALSPVSKEPCDRWRGQGKISNSSHVTHCSGGPQCLQKAKPKRKRACYRRLDVSYMSARTRPLLTHHKPRLFIMEPVPQRDQGLEDSFCDPLQCTNPKWLLMKHPVLSLSSETPLSFHLENALFEESLLPQSFLLKTNRSSLHHCLRSRVSRSLFQCSHRKKSGRHLKTEHCNLPYKRRRRHCFETTDPEVSSVASQSENEDVYGKVSYCTPSQQRFSQFPLTRRSCDSIDDIIVPMSRFTSVKLERLQYKKILTPSWRKVNISPLLKREDDELETELLEELDDADVLQRHQLLENSEKLQWCRWDQEGAQGWRRTSSLSVRKWTTHCYPSAFSPVLSTYTFGSPQDLLEDTEPLLPWKRRTFPLTDEDEGNLRISEDEYTI